MPVVQRDELYRQIYQKLGLDPEDRGNLIERGIRDLEPFRSIGKQTAIDGASDAPPGFKKKAGRLIPLVDLGSGRAGYLCPAKDFEGRIQAFQVRLREGDKKYSWLAGPALPSGCYPLSVCYPAVDSPKIQTLPTILFCEGIGPKPILIADRWGTPCIGAAGGNFTASATTLRDQIEGVIAKIKSELPSDQQLHVLRLVLVPDAWGMGNPSVAARDKKTCDLLAEISREIVQASEYDNTRDPKISPLKVTVKVASWGQEFDVLGKDGDEIDLGNCHPTLRPADRYFSQTPNDSQLAIAAIYRYLRDNKDTRSELKDKVALNTIAGERNLTAQQVGELWQQLEQSVKRQTPDPDVVEAYVSAMPIEVLRSLAKAPPIEETIAYYLDGQCSGDGDFASELARFCKILGVPEMAAVVALGPVVASVIRPSVRLVGMVASGLKGRPGNWAMVVGESGAAKSPLCNALISPLFAIQKDHNQRFFQPIYESWLKQPPRQRGPEPRAYTAIATNTTSEAISVCQAANGDQGLLAYADEMGKIFTMDQYKAGGGSSRQDLLEMRGGMPSSVRRVGKGGSHDVNTNGVQILGGVQPDVYKKLFDSEDPDGFLARLNITFIPRWRGTWDDGEDTRIPERLRAILIKVRSYPTANYIFSDEAQAEFSRWYAYCQSAKLSAKSRALASVYSKSVGEVLNRCVELHTLNWALTDTSGCSPSSTVTLRTLHKAIDLVRYQIKMATQMAALTVKDERAERYAYIINVSRKSACDSSRVETDNLFCGWIDASNVRRAFRDSKDAVVYFGSANEIKDLFREMSANGFGSVRSRDTDIEFRANPSQLDRLALEAGPIAREFVFSGARNADLPNNASDHAAASHGSVQLADRLLGLNASELLDFWRQASNWDEYMLELADRSPPKARELDALLVSALTQLEEAEHGQYVL